jgi:hypothetical protein
MRTNKQTAPRQTCLTHRERSEMKLFCEKAPQETTALLSIWLWVGDVRSEKNQGAHAQVYHSQIRCLGRKAAWDGEHGEMPACDCDPGTVAAREVARCAVVSARHQVGRRCPPFAPRDHSIPPKGILQNVQQNPKWTCKGAHREWSLPAAAAAAA